MLIGAANCCKFTAAAAAIGTCLPYLIVIPSATN